MKEIGAIGKNTTSPPNYNQNPKKPTTHRLKTQRNQNRNRNHQNLQQKRYPQIYPNQIKINTKKNEQLSAPNPNNNHKKKDSLYITDKPTPKEKKNTPFKTVTQTQVAQNSK